MKSESYPRPAREGTYLVAFAEAAKIIGGCGLEGKALDFGCGWGRSSSFLANLGFDVVGVDKNADLLCDEKNDGFNCCLTHDDRLPFPDNSFDLIFSSFVFVDFSSREQIDACVEELIRVAKDGGHLMVIHPTVESYLGKWNSFDCDFAENENLTSGDQAKVQVNGSAEISDDFIWSEEDLEVIYKRNGLKIVEKSKPLEDGKPAWVVYLLRKG